MSTVTKEIADKIIANNGRYGDDPIVTSIIEYDNAWGGVGYGLNTRGRDIYTASPYIRNPRIYWERKHG